jgi:ATP-dependent 26S proteasome regulatory subunit
MTIVRNEAGKWSASNKDKRVKTDNKTLQQLVNNLQGVSYSEVRRLAPAAIVDDGVITSDVIPNVNKVKFELMDMDDILSFEYDTAKFSDVGGLNNLKRWLTERKSAFHEEGEYSLQTPKGIILLGVQGGGP